MHPVSSSFPTPSLFHPLPSSTSLPSSTPSPLPPPSSLPPPPLFHLPPSSAGTRLVKTDGSSRNYGSETELSNLYKMIVHVLKNCTVIILIERSKVILEYCQRDKYVFVLRRSGVWCWVPSVLAVVWRSSWVSGLAANFHVKSRSVLTKSCGAGIGLASLGECCAALSCLSTKDIIVESYSTLYS